MLLEVGHPLLQVVGGGMVTLMPMGVLIRGPRRQTREPREAIFRLHQGLLGLFEIVIGLAQLVVGIAQAAGAFRHLASSCSLNRVISAHL